MTSHNFWPVDEDTVGVAVTASSGQSPPSSSNGHLVDSADIPQAQQQRSPSHMRWHSILAYGLGHFYNDLCACMWFTYLLLFLQKVLRFKSYQAGMLMLIGQATDAVCTPLVGLGSDRAPLPGLLRSFGRRKSWHLLGTLCVTVSFPLIFNHCLACSDSWSEWARVLYFVPFIMLFQFGWSSVQISHLALIPELATTDSLVTTLTCLRFGFTVIANITVFAILGTFLLMSEHAHEKVSEKDFRYFRDSDLIVVLLGCFAAAIFHFGVKEPRTQGGRVRRRLRSSVDAASLSHSGSLTPTPRMNFGDWLRQPQFYQIALLYMMSRLYINVSQVYYPFYIQMAQNFPKRFVAMFPLVVYLGAFATSSVITIPWVNKRLNRKFVYLFGASIGIGCCFWLWFFQLKFQLYGLSFVMGISQAIILVMSTALTAELINRNTESGAFVYGAMSFVDKLSNGIAYQIIEIINPSCDPNLPHSECAVFYRGVMSYVPGGAIVIATLVLITLLPQKIGKRPTVSVKSRIEDGEGLLTEE